MTSAKSKAISKPKEGSRKAKVRALFDKQGQDAAWVLGLKLKLAQSTLRSWFATWRREAAPTKRKAVKKMAKPKAKQAAIPTTAPAPATPSPVTSSDQPELIPQFLHG